MEASVRERERERSIFFLALHARCLLILNFRLPRLWRRSWKHQEFHMRYTFIQAMHMHSWTGLQKVWRGGRAWDCLMRMKLRLSWLGLASSLGWLVTYLHKYVLSYVLLPWTPAFVVVDIFKPQVCRLFSFGNNGCNWGFTWCGNI